MESDATLIIFNCGNYERIGFRCRKNQTLYLSDLVDVCAGSNPRYGQLQIGLYMIILQDALERVRSIKNKSSRTATKRKRSDDVGSDASEPVSKKLRSRSSASKLQKSTDDIQAVVSTSQYLSTIR